MYFSHFIDLELLFLHAAGTSLVLLGRTEFFVCVSLCLYKSQESIPSTSEGHIVYFPQF